MSEGLLFSKLLKGHIGASCTYECWGKVYSLTTTALLVFFLSVVKSLKNL